MALGNARVLVTGASGFIGRFLCRRLREGGFYVIGMTRGSPVVECARCVICDLHSDGDLSRALDGVDVVFHLAGKAHSLSEVRQDDDEYFRINTLGTKSLLGAARRAGVRRFVFFSSIKAEDVTDCRGGAIKQQVGLLGPQPSGASTPYGRSKLEAERLVLEGGFIPEPVVLRLCMVYGADAKGNILKMLDAVRRDRFPPLPEVGNCRSMVHVEDVVDAALLAAIHPKAPGNCFIVSDGIGYSTRQIYELMCAALKRPVPSWHLPVWTLALLGLMGDQIGRLRGRRFVFDSDALEKLIGSAWYSSKFIEEQLGFRPRWNLERALPEMVAALPPVSVR